MSTDITALERRYRRLLRFYPGQYRKERGEEIVGTYLEFAAPRSRPSLADTGDIIKSGLKKRTQYAPSGLRSGIGMAAVVALSVLTAMSVAAISWIELGPTPDLFFYDSFGPFKSTAILMWGLWIAVAIGAALAPPRVTRFIIPVPLVAIAVQAFIPAVTTYAAPPNYLLGPLFILGVTALAWPHRAGILARIAPVLSGIGAAVVAAGLSLQTRESLYRDDVYEIMRYSIAAILVAGFALAIIDYAARRSTAGAWALMVLAGPTIMMAAVFPTLNHLVDASTTPAFVHVDQALAPVKAAGYLLLIVGVPLTVRAVVRKR